MKKLLALLLALTMVLSMAACSKTPEATEPSASSDPSTESTAPTEPIDEDYNVDYSNNSVYAGAVTTALGTAGGGEVGYDVYAGTPGKDYSDPEYYTMNDFTAGMTDMKWSTHTWETSDDSAILDYITAGFYTFALNSTGTGWSVVCEMAAELPVDVTADYVGQFGIAEGDSLKAWKIALNPNACWEDGTPINADSYIYSYQELLDPLMKNRRADSLYAGDFIIHGAKEYFYQGQSVTLAASDAFAEYSEDLDAQLVFSLAPPSGNIAEVYMRTSFGFPASYDAAACADYLIGNYLGECAFTAEAAAAMEGMTLADIKADETLKAAWEALIGWWQTEPNEELHFFLVNQSYPEYSWDNVGIVKTGEYELVMITTLPIENANYYVPYNLSGTYLVYEPLWESCKSYYDSNNNKVDADSDNIATITTNYCTSAETTMSFGPYRLDYFELDKQYNLTRNDNWYGYSDGKHVGQYQTDEISVQVLADHATQLMAFESGMVDGVGLQQDDMEKYGSSSYLLYTPESYTTKLTFNSNVDSLTAHGTGSQVLANANFRKAFSLAIDRYTYCSSLTAGHLPGFGLLNTMYVYDPFTGAAYRNTDGAMDALVKLYGLTYGDDENAEYGSLEEAYEAITGYDMTAAQALMAQAYDECVAAGLYDGTSNITLEFCVYQNDELYVKIFNFINDALVAACKGSGFEGKVSLSMKVDADYYNTMYSGNTDIIFSTWGGAAYSPYTMLDQCYCDSATGEGNQMEYGFETDKVMVTINVDGHDVTTNLQNWAAWAGNEDVTITSDDGELTLARFGEYDADTRSYMFSKLEYAYLAFFTTTPLYYRNSVSIHSQKINYAVTDYVDLVGYGGIQFITYNYTDAEWAAVAGTLTY